METYQLPKFLSAQSPSALPVSLRDSDVTSQMPIVLASFHQGQTDQGSVFAALASTPVAVIVAATVIGSFTFQPVSPFMPFNSHW